MKKILFIFIGLLLVSGVVAQNMSKKELKALEKRGFRYIPAGHCTVFYDSFFPPNKSTAYTFTEFFMLETEVSNMLYMEFLQWLKNHGDTAKYTIAAIDTNQWKRYNMYNEAEEKAYFSHPMYRYCPVVNISYEGAMLFCEWLTQIINREGWMVTLPTRAQWIYAAAQSLRTSDTCFRIWNTYPFGPYLTNAKKWPQYNYHRIGDESIVKKDTDYSSAVSHAMIKENNSVWNVRKWSIPVHLSQTTLPVKSFWPNRAGLYNMSGNVAEMVLEKGIAVGGSWNDPGGDITILSYKKYTNPSPMVGFRPILIIKP